ncbi:MAG: 5-methyltetrahydropteroyltriglutamate--homocysteine S-methyltransferase [Myxococcota bacterium]
MITTTTLGYPRIGAERDLKWVLENYWAGRSSLMELEQGSTTLFVKNLEAQRELGLDCVPVGDFSLYDHVLDAAFALNAVPSRFAHVEISHPLERYFLMARGKVPGVAAELSPLEMTKWFDTNYHYLVPEIEAATRFAYTPGLLAQQFRRARELGFQARPVVLGPVSFFALAKNSARGTLGFQRLDELIDAYRALLSDLVALGADWVQLDEPCLVLDLDDATRAAYRRAYAALAKLPLKILVATYFGRLGDNLPLALELPVSGLHVDGLADLNGAESLARGIGSERVLSLGIVDGRNIWRADLEHALALGERVLTHIDQSQLWLAPTCSLLHVPVDLQPETELDAELFSYIAFARQKLQEIAVLRRGLESGRKRIASELAESHRIREARRSSTHTRNAQVRQRLAEMGAQHETRPTPGVTRRKLQRQALGLPQLPTTSIGSFPQTNELRRARAAQRSGALDGAGYRRELERAIDEVIRAQEKLGLDVLVHGEPERNDMVEFFGERLLGMAVTRHGWVQSYGSRCVKPPIIYGDVRRAGPLTLDFATYAQSKSQRPVKGMLTGPVTMMKWSFVRDDEPLEHTARTLALALRDEVADLEAAGIRVIQVDEPAFREALPLRKADRGGYLTWAVRAFRLATSGVRDTTQIHTHMCYSEFGDVMPAIRALDADVISIECARSAMDLLHSFKGGAYQNDVGLGVYDIHSPRVPSVAEIASLLRAALTVLEPEQVWVNPDCGLKTRGWAEITPALENMVQAARSLRAELEGKTP